MPYAPPRLCNRCHQPFTGQRCPCRPAWEGSPQRAARGRRWTELRNAKLRADPYCQHPDCPRLADTVDHIVPIAEDPTREYDWTNLKSLCRTHAQQKNTQDALRGKQRPR